MIQGSITSPPGRWAIEAMGAVRGNEGEGSPRMIESLPPSEVSQHCINKGDIPIKVAKILINVGQIDLHLLVALAMETDSRSKILTRI